MKKSSFLEGAMIATIGIIICKIIGLLYVIPFKNIIGEQGGALYGYAYSIYAIFLSLSTSGIPVAMSKVISEYNSLEYYHTKEKAYKIGSYIIAGIGIISFLILMIFAPQLAKLILGDLEGGNTIEGVTLVIRIVSTAILVVPLLSVTKGYLQGHKFMTEASLANVIEQLARVIVIILGSFVALKVFKLSLETTVGIAVFGATVGALVAYFYLVSKIKKNKESLKRNEVITRAEAKITNKEIAKKIITYAIPFIIIELVKSAHSMIDTMTVVNTLASLGLSQIAETTIGVLTVWASKLNMIVISISLGITISLIPNLSSSYANKNMEDVNHKINQSLQLILFISLPMTVGLSFLAQPVWTLFYGYDAFSINLFRIFIYQAITFSIYSILIDSAQTLNYSKLALGTLIGSFISKAILNIPIMYLFNTLNIGAQYAPVVTTLLIHTVATIILLYYLNKKFKVDYKKSFYNSIKVILCSGIMLITLKIINLFFPINSITRGGALIEIGIYSMIGAGVYIVAGLKSGTINNILGNNFIDKITVMLKDRMKKE
ncbi:MAG: polysaccharide biosynthesis protein [Bacilli bacterium]|nr:polysaccharide biosynthesis protein [Bacilli bacterium]